MRGLSHELPHTRTYGSTAYEDRWMGKVDIMTAINPDYAKWPSQMFGRDPKPFDDCYVVLIAKKHQMTEQARDSMRASYTGFDPHIKAKLDPLSALCDSYYTFEWRCTTLRALWQGADPVIDAATGDVTYPNADPASTQRTSCKHSFPSHPDDSAAGGDPFATISETEVRQVVGGWRVGKITDTAARARSDWYVGPVNGSDAVTVNVCVEWHDWRALRGRSGRDDIGSYVSGFSINSSSYSTEKSYTRSS